MILGGDGREELVASVDGQRRRMRFPACRFQHYRPIPGREVVEPYWQGYRRRAGLQQSLEEAAPTQAGEVEKVEDFGSGGVVTGAPLGQTEGRQPGAQGFPRGVEICGSVADDSMGESAGSDARGHQDQGARIVDAISDVAAKFGAQPSFGIGAGESDVDQFDEGPDRPGQVVLEVGAGRWSERAS